MRCAVLAGVAGKTMVPNMWSVLPGDASSSILSHQIAIIRSKHTYLLSLTAHLPLSRTRRRMYRAKWLFIALGYRRSGNGGIRGYAMGPVLHTVDMGTRFNILAADYWLHSSLTAYELYFKMP